MVTMVMNTAKPIHPFEPENLAQFNLKINRLAIETGFVQHASSG